MGRGQFLQVGETFNHDTKDMTEEAVLAGKTVLTGGRLNLDALNEVCHVM